jgi:2-haloacid dehalogenase
LCAAALADAQGRKVDSVAPSVCVFDVNEMLLDIEFIEPMFQRLFGDRKVLREWFYTTFFNLGQGVLRMLGPIHNVVITEADVDELRTRMLTMPAHTDVPAGLKLLKDAGSRLVTPPDPQRCADVGSTRESADRETIARPTLPLQE